MINYLLRSRITSKMFGIKNSNLNTNKMQVDEVAEVWCVCVCERRGGYDQLLLTTRRHVNLKASPCNFFLHSWYAKNPVPGVRLPPQQ